MILVYAIWASILGVVSVAAPAHSLAQALPEAREVEIGILLADLTEVRGSEQAFGADVLLLATWTDETLAGSTAAQTLDLDEVWHPTLIIYNRRTATESLPRQVTVQPDGTLVYMQRYTGLFSASMDLREFPKDRQEFFIWLVSPARVGPAVRLVPMTSLPVLAASELSISDWDIGELSLGSETFHLAPGAPANPGIRLTIPGTRRVTYYTIQVLIPLVAIVMMAYTVFWVAPTVVPTRVGVVVTTMLTLIAYRFMLANHVPRLSYLTRLDWFMLGATLLVVFALFTMALTAFLISHERDAVVRRIDIAGRILYPLAFAVLAFATWF